MCVFLHCPGVGNNRNNHLHAFFGRRDASIITTTTSIIKKEKIAKIVEVVVQAEVIL